MLSGPSLRSGLGRLQFALGDRRRSLSAEEFAQTGAQPVEEKDGEMSEAQARALLRSMQGEEEKVRQLERQQNQGVIKDW